MAAQTHDPQHWPNRFRDGWALGLAPIFERYRENFFLYEWISQDFSNATNVLEIGAGRGYNSLILKFMNPKIEIMVSDYLAESLDIIKESLQKAHINNKIFDYVRLDAITEKIPLRTTYTFSDGVLEHFSDDEIIQAIRNQASAATICFVVPVNNAAIDYGDERILPHSSWVKLIHSALGPNARYKIFYLPIGHSNLFFRLIRKLCPPFKKNGKTAHLTQALNAALLPIETKFADSICYKICLSGR